MSIEHLLLHLLAIYQLIISIREVFVRAKYYKQDKLLLSVSRISQDCDAISCYPPASRSEVKLYLMIDTIQIQMEGERGKD